MAFLRNHREAIAAMDFFVVPTATFRSLTGLIVIEHGRCRVLNWAVTNHPTAEWVVRVLRNAFPHDEGPEYLIHDRDARFGAHLKEAIKRMHTTPKQTSFHCPWQNPVAERFIATIRRDLLDHVVILGQDHLARLLGEYIRYYHAGRTRLGLDKDSPEPRT